MAENDAGRSASQSRSADNALDSQRDHWRQTFARRPALLGASASEPAVDALARFGVAGVSDLLELGACQGRDTLRLAGAGLNVTALDYADEGLQQLSRDAADAGLDGIAIVTADVRQPLPFADESFDACYAHLLFCMALTTSELERLTDEVRRVLRPGGLLVYTVRTTADAHYGIGKDHGDDMFETDGFIVHFFDRALVDHLAQGFEVVQVADYQEGKLPRQLFGVTMRKAGGSGRQP